MHSERRKHERIQQRLPVSVKLGREPDQHAGHIVNISGGGMLLETDLSVSTNDQVTVALQLIGEADPIYIYGTVVRKDARGYGVAFVRVGDITANLISYLMRKWQREGALAAKA